jgi:hypothetical protein
MNQKQLRQPERWISHPKMGAKMGSAKYCDELKMAEARPRSEVGKPCSNHAPVAGKDRRLKETRENTENEDCRECRACGEIAGEGREKCADGPGDDGDAVDALGTEAVEQAARRQLPQRIGPSEGEEQVAQALRVHVHRRRHVRNRL